MVRAVGASQPDLPGAGAVADERNSSIRRVSGIAIAGGRGNQIFRLPLSCGCNAVDIDIFVLVYPAQSPGFPGYGGRDRIECTLNDTFRGASSIQWKSPEPENATPRWHDRIRLLPSGVQACPQMPPPCAGHPPRFTASGRHCINRVIPEPATRLNAIVRPSGENLGSQSANSPDAGDVEPACFSRRSGPTSKSTSRRSEVETRSENTSLPAIWRPVDHLRHADAFKSTNFFCSPPALGTSENCCRRSEISLERDPLPVGRPDGDPTIPSARVSVTLTGVFRVPFHIDLRRYLQARRPRKGYGFAVGRKGWSRPPIRLARSRVRFEGLQIAASCPAARSTTRQRLRSRDLMREPLRAGSAAIPHVSVRGQSHRAARLRLRQKDGGPGPSQASPG